MAEAPKKDGKGGKGGGGGGLKFTVREEGQAEPVTVSIHPSSVNAKASHIGLQPLSHRVAASVTCQRLHPLLLCSLDSLCAPHLLRRAASSLATLCTRR